MLQVPSRPAGPLESHLRQGERGLRPGHLSSQEGSSQTGQPLLVEHLFDTQFELASDEEVEELKAADYPIAIYARV